MKNNFKFDVILTFLVQILVAISNFVILFYITRYMGTEDYGEFYLIKRVSDLLWVSLLLGLTVSIPRNIHKVNNIFSILITGVIVASVSILIIIFLPSHIISFFIGEIKFVSIFKVLVISQIIFGIINSIQRGLEQFINYNVFNIINFIFNPLLSLYFSNDLYSYLYHLAYISLFTNISIFLITTIIICKRQKECKINKNDTKYILKYGLSRIPGLVLASFIFTLPIFLMDLFNQHTLKGIVSQIFQMYSLVLLPINTLGTLILPKISKAIFTNDRQLYNKLYSKLFKLNLIVVLTSILLLIVIPVILFLANNNYNFEYYHIIIIIGILPLAFYNLYRNPIDALSEKPITTYIVLFSFIISFILFTIVRYIPDVNYEWLISVYVLILYTLLGSLTFFVFKIINRRYMNG